jgi:cell division protein ZapE
MTAAVTERYRALVAAGTLEEDAAQSALAGRLDLLAADLGAWRPRRRSALLGRLLARQAAPPPRGLYIWGPVGRGKTALMDLFFAVAPVARKRRVHFHAFMAEVHARIHRFRQSLGRGEVRDADPIPPLAETLAGEARLLCLDEFQVTDIADAMILGRLFEALLDRGVVIVATSNTPPRELYKGGLNRALFLPFIALIEARLDVMELAARTDFRLEKLSRLPSWHVPADAAADAALDAAFRRLAGAFPHREMLTVQGRRLMVPAAAQGVARFGFAALCRRPLGPADYLAIAERYHTLIVDHIPVMAADQRNERRRFIILIDTLYDHRVKLIASAEAEPAALMRGGAHAEEFERTASRLMEMRGADWLALPHGREGSPPAPAESAAAS